MQKTPDDRKYTKDHEWIKLEKNGYVVGISDHAQEQLTDVVFIELPQPGVFLKKGDRAASIESVKAVSDIYAPAGGKITEVNSALEDKPELINEKPYTDGWIFKIELSDESELNGLMSGSEYSAFIGE